MDGDDLAWVVDGRGAPESVEFGDVAEDVAFVDVGTSHLGGPIVVLG